MARHEIYTCAICPRKFASASEVRNDVLLSGPSGNTNYVGVCDGCYDKVNSMVADMVKEAPGIPKPAIAFA